MLSGVAFAGEADALAIARPRLDAHSERLGAGDHALTLAHVADRARMSGAAADRARNIELHAAGGLSHLAAAAAIRTDAGRLQMSGAMAVGADILLLDVQPQLGSADGLPEPDVDLVFEVAARFGASLFGRAAAPAEYSGANV